MQSAHQPDDDERDSNYFDSPQPQADTLARASSRDSDSALTPLRSSEGADSDVAGDNSCPATKKQRSWQKRLSITAGRIHSVIKDKLQRDSVELDGIANAGNFNYINHHIDVVFPPSEAESNITIENLTLRQI